MDKCQNCNQRIIRARHNTDVNHECNSGHAALDQEDVLVIGDWEDFSGSGTVQDSVLMTAGTSNLLQGTEAELEGERFGGVTDRGKKKQLYRQRQRITHNQFRLI